MKLFSNCSALVVVSLLVGVCFASAEGTSKRLTRAELIELRANSQKKKATFLSDAAVTEKVASNHPSNSDLFNRSLVIGNGSVWTFVPKGSLLYVPEDFSSRIDVEPKGRFVEFPLFLSKNRSWIRNYEVTLNQARGKESLAEGARENFSDFGRVVVSTLQGGPITVRERKEEELTKK